MIVKHAYYVNILPNHIAVEFADGHVMAARQTPFRYLTDADLSDMAGLRGEYWTHAKKTELPDAVYRYYGLVKSE